MLRRQRRFDFYKMSALSLSARILAAYTLAVAVGAIFALVAVATIANVLHFSIAIDRATGSVAIFTVIAVVAIAVVAVAVSVSVPIPPVVVAISIAAVVFAGRIITTTGRRGAATTTGRTAPLAVAVTVTARIEPPGCAWRSPCPLKLR